MLWMILYACVTLVSSTSWTTGTTLPYGCVENGVHYNPGDTISEGRHGNWCFGKVCEDNGIIISWDDWNCGTTTTSPRTTLPPVSTTPSIIVDTCDDLFEPGTAEHYNCLGITPSTTTIGFIPKCVHGSSIYLPGQEITTFNNGTMCSTLMCGENSVTYTVEHCDCFITNPITVSFCAIGGVCYAAGQADPKRDCLVCDPSKSMTSFALSADYCYIGGVCYDDGSPNPYRQCQRCTSATNNSAWTTVPAVPIKLGQTLSSNDICNAYGSSGYKLRMICKYAAVLPAAVVFTCSIFW